MDEKKLKTIIIYICCGVLLASALFCGGIWVGTKIESRKSTGGSNISTSANIESIESDLTRLKSDNDKLAAERDELIEQLSVSNGKLDAISTELQQCSKDIASQSAEYSERITNANNDILEYNRIVTERILKLCDRMEESINTIAAECGVDYSQTE